MKTNKEKFLKLVEKEPSPAMEKIAERKANKKISKLKIFSKWLSTRNGRIFGFIVPLILSILSLLCHYC